MYNRQERRVVGGGDDREGGRLKSGTRYTVVSHVQGFGAISNK